MCRMCRVARVIKRTKGITTTAHQVDPDNNSVKGEEADAANGQGPGGSMSTAIVVNHAPLVGDTSSGGEWVNCSSMMEEESGVNGYSIAASDREIGECLPVYNHHHQDENGFAAAEDNSSSNARFWRHNTVKLNVGGMLYHANMSTLAQYPESTLGQMLTSWTPTYNKNEEIMIDFDGPTFAYVLEFLRHGEIAAFPLEFRSLSLMRLAAKYFHLRELERFLDTELNGVKDVSNGDHVQLNLFGINACAQSFFADAQPITAFVPSKCRHLDTRLLGSVHTLPDQQQFTCCPSCFQRTSLKIAAQDSLDTKELYKNVMRRAVFEVVNNSVEESCVIVAKNDSRGYLHVSKMFLKKI